MAVKMEYPNPKGSLKLRVEKGHFATSHSHINYYVDLTFTKHRLSEAKEAARLIAGRFGRSSVIDTVLCLDGTELIGACLAEKLIEMGVSSINTHHTVYVVTPEHTSGSQLIFRDNTQPMIRGKHVLIVAASVTTGYTVRGAIEALNYYGGMCVGVSAIFASADLCMGYPVYSVFDNKHYMEDYMSSPSQDCPLCKAGVKLDALVNTYGISYF